MPPASLHRPSTFGPADGSFGAVPWIFDQQTTWGKSETITIFATNRAHRIRLMHSIKIFSGRLTPEIFWQGGPLPSNYTHPWSDSLVRKNIAEPRKHLAEKRSLEARNRMLHFQMVGALQPRHENGFAQRTVEALKRQGTCLNEHVLQRHCPLVRALHKIGQTAHLKIANINKYNMYKVQKLKKK